MKRLKANSALIGSLNFRKIFATAVKLILLIGLTFVIIYPFIIKLSCMFMSEADIYDDTVSLIPRTPTLETVKFIIEQSPFKKATVNTFVLSLTVSLLTVFCAVFVGYGLGRFSFKGRNAVFVCVVLSLLVPIQSTVVPMYSYFRYFDIFGLFQRLSGSAVTLTDTYYPLIILSVTGFGFRGGLLVLMMMQKFKELPHEMTEAAYIDGAGPWKTFLLINLPLARSVIVVVFIISFAWQWTDNFYTSNLCPTLSFYPRVIAFLSSTSAFSKDGYTNSVAINAAVLMIIIPVMVLFVIFQRQIIQGVERTGLVG